MNVAREEVSFLAMFNHATHGTGHVTREVEGEVDLFASPSNFTRVSEGHGGEGVFNAFDILFNVEWEVLIARFLALAFHHLN